MELKRNITGWGNRKCNPKVLQECRRGSTILLLPIEMFSSAVDSKRATD
jgi:hypothetical protein